MIMRNDLPAMMAAELATTRGSMVLVTERRRNLSVLTCEVCRAKDPGGIARGVIVHERDDSDCVWLLWMLPNGWSMTDESANGPIVACAKCQSVAVVRDLRFAS